MADVACTAPRSGRGAVEHGSRAGVIVPRRGVFLVHRAADVVVADATSAVVLGADEEYRVSHPVEGGDRCASIKVRDDLAEEIVGARRGAIAMRPATQLAFGVLAGALRRPGGAAADALAAEEGALVALAELARDAGRLRAAAVPAPAARRRVAEVRALLAGAPGSDWWLDAVARAVHSSPFHLARQFRALTGETIAGHLLRLRMGLALDRLADGEDDLGRLSVELGFAHHSHFSARFGQLFGITPSRARGARAGDLRTILTAAAPARP